MTRERVVRPGKTGPTLLMLLLVTAGLFIMHTVGHLGVHESIPAGHAHSLAGQEGIAPAVAQMPQDMPVMPIGSTVICVAILCTMISLGVAITLARRTRARRNQLAQPVRWIAGTVRGPPKVQIGLVLADLSVLRN